MTQHDLLGDIISDKDNIIGSVWNTMLKTCNIEHEMQQIDVSHSKNINDRVFKSPLGIENKQQLIHWILPQIPPLYYQCITHKIKKCVILLVTKRQV